MSSFKYKPAKIKWLNVIDTLDSTHQKIVLNFERNRDELPQKKKKLLTCETQLEKLSQKKVNDLETHTKLLNSIKKLRDEIYDIENNVSEIDYYSKSNSILFNYFDIVDKHNSKPSPIDDNIKIESEATPSDDELEETEVSTEVPNKAARKEMTALEKLSLLSQKKRKYKKPTKKRNKRDRINKDTKNILDFFRTPSEKSETSKAHNTDETRSSLFNDYMMVVDSDYHHKKLKYTHIHVCESCKVDKILIQSEGIYVCPKCAQVEHIIIESEIPNYKDPVQNRPSYPYKRINHFVEWLSQWQAKESTDIPKEIYEKILDEIKKNRIRNLNNITLIKMKEILKKLRLHQYYEHIPHIISKLTGNPPPMISREMEEKLKIMFKQIQEPFAKYCPPNRTNFLSYSYVLHKFCQLLELDDFLKYFPLLKSRDKLRIQDRIWEKICNDLGWAFYPSI